MLQLPTIDELLTAGVHFGHLSSRWNPKMRDYIFTTRSRIHVINLEKTLEKLKVALDYLKDAASRGETILFVGTKRQAKDEVKRAALSCGMPYVTIRWLGGTFTNFKTIQRTIKKLEKLHQMKEAKDFEVKYTKKERLLLEREIAKLENLFEGIKTMKKLPEAIFAVDVGHDKIAVKEARSTRIKVIGLVDTNSSVDAVDYPIPSNDDAIKSISLMVDLAAAAVNEGKANPVGVGNAGNLTRPSATLPASPAGGPSPGEENKETTNDKR